MNLRLRAERGRIAALAILAVLIALVWLGPISAYVDLVGSAADDIARQTALLHRYQVLATVPRAEPGGPSAGAQAMLVEASETQAAALLQERVKNAATASKVQIQTVQVLRSENFANATRIGVRMRGSGDSASLGRLLFDIESERPVLYPDNLQILVRPGTASAETLDFQLDISGFVAGGAS